MKIPHILLIPMLAQTPPARLEFDVASIKPAAPTGDRGTNMSTSRGTLRMHNASLRFCVMAAYAVQDNQIEGGPKWMNSDQFEILAKSESAPNDEQLVRMLQTLLAGRFKLVIHRETRQRPVYALLVGKNGSKLLPSTGGDSSLVRRGRGAAVPLTGKNTSISALAATLSMLTGRKILDQTGLHGLYDFTLQFAPVDAVDSPLPSLVTALQEQLGLRLDATNGPVEVLVIDHAEKPSVD